MTSPTVFRIFPSNLFGLFAFAAGRCFDVDRLKSQFKLIVNAFAGGQPLAEVMSPIEFGAVQRSVGRLQSEYVSVAGWLFPLDQPRQGRGVITDGDGDPLRAVENAKCGPAVSDRWQFMTKTMLGKADLRRWIMIPFGLMGCDVRIAWLDPVVRCLEFLEGT